MEPDESLLGKYVRGELDDESAEAVRRAVERNPALLSTLDRLAGADTFASGLRGRTPAPPDPPFVEACIGRGRQLRPDPGAGDTTSSREPPPDTVDHAAAPPPPAPEVPERLRGYRVVRLLGAGGMGLVYEAADDALGRRVALKVMRPDFAADPKARARFVREAKAAARVEHDHVVPIFHIDEDGDRPFLAMPFLRGEPLDVYAKRVGRLSAAELLKVGREAALGLAAAHAHGLTHRDVKPGNLWREETADGWRVKVLDFGLARATADGEDAITRPGAVVGTPAYMAPEQARSGAVDPRADLFSLGATLYALATGRPPFGSGPVMSVLTALAVETPPPVRGLNPDVPAALSDLIARLLAKDPAARPQTARDVADRLAAIEHDMAAARPPRRRRIALVAAGLVLFIVVLVAGYKLVVETPSGTFVVRVTDPAVEARFKNGELHILDRDGKVRYTLKPAERDRRLPAGDYRIRVTGADGLSLDTDEFTIRRGEESVVHVRLVPPATPRAAPPPPTIPPADPAVFRREDIPPELLAAAGRGDPRNAPASLVAVFGTPRPVHTAQVLGLAYSPDGKWLASAGGDKVILLTDTATGAVRRRLAGHTGMVFAVAFRPDSTTLVSASDDGTLRVWRTDRDEVERVVEHGIGPTDWVAMAVTAAGDRVAVGGAGGVIRLWEWGLWDRPEEIRDLAGAVRIRALAFDPAGELLAAGGVPRDLSKPTATHVFTARDRTPAFTLPAAGNQVLALRFGRDGTRLAVGGAGPPVGGVQVWDVPGRKLLFQAPIFREHAHAVALAADNTTLAVCDGDNQLQVHDTAAKKVLHVYNGNWGNILRSVAYSPDGGSLAFGAANGLVQVWDADLGIQRYLDRWPRHHVLSVAARPDGRFVLLAGDECVLYRRNPADPGRGPPPVQYRAAVRRVAFAPDGKTYAAAVGTYSFHENSLHVFDAATHAEAAAVKARYAFDLAASPDGKYLAVASVGGVALHDAATGKELHWFKDREGLVWSAAWGPGGRLASANEQQKTVTVWDAETGNEVRTWTTEQGAVAVAYDPQGRWVAAGDRQGAITLWDPADDKPVRTLTGHTHAVRTLRFTADGNRLVSAAHDGTVRVWDPEASRAKEVADLLAPHPDLAPAFDLDRTGRYVYAAAADGLIYVLRCP
jgi:WD40 repeat protein